MKQYDSIGIQVPQVHLPKPGNDLTRWAVIACDQFTSQPEYWDQVKKTVGDAPSTYHLILPEVYLGTPEEGERVHNIQAKMKEYLERQTIVPIEGFIYIERQTGEGKTRKGLMMALDLERYDFNKGSQSLIRATEGTIIERLPPRMKIREGAPLELPHIIVLIDDPAGTVIEAVAEKKAQLKKIYDFDLMLGSGHLTGYHVSDPEVEQKVIKGLENLADPKTFQKKYAVDDKQAVLLFAMGDGNHSLATAKAIWEKMKPHVGMNHPARYALVEIENVHDTGLDFEPIHRVLFDLKQDIFAAMQAHFGQDYSFIPCKDAQEMVKGVDYSTGVEQVIGVVSEKGCGLISISHPTSNLPVGTLQTFLDAFMKNGGATKIDYVHGEEVVTRLGAQPGNIGFYLPAMNKSDLFKTVILDGALPRKTFSMGEAKEKRFYVECRKIVE